MGVEVVFDGLAGDADGIGDHLEGLEFIGEEVDGLGVVVGCGLHVINAIIMLDMKNVNMIKWIMIYLI